MKKNKIVVIITIIIMITLHIHAQSLTFQQISEDTARTFARTITKTEDNGCIINMGTTNYSNYKRLDISLLKMDSLYNIKWVKKIDVDTTDSNSCFAHGVLYSLKHGIIIGGAIYPKSPTAGILIKINDKGNISWSKRYNCSAIMPIRINDDGSIFICSIGTYWPSDIVIAKLDSNGSVLWSKNYGGNSSEYYYNSIPTFDGGIIVSGYSDYHPFVLKIDSLGQTQWQKTFIDSANLYIGVYSIAQTLDSGFVLPLYSSTPYTQGLIKLNKYGHIEWAKQFLTKTTFNRSSSLARLLSLPNGDIVSLGMYYNNNTNIYTGTLLCTDSNANVLWHRHYDQFDPKLFTQFYDLLQTMDKGFMIVGLTAQLPLKEHLYIVKTDSLGHTECNNEKDLETWTEDLFFNAIEGDSVADFELTSEDFQVYVSDVDLKMKKICGNLGVDVSLVYNDEGLTISPNPFTTTATIEINTEKAINNWYFELYNLYGEQVMEINDINTNHISISRAGLSNGLYFYKVSTEQQQEVGKGKLLIVD